MASIPTIRKIANWIGSTGEYPFTGILMVVQQIPASEKPTADTLVSDAVASYSTVKGFVNKDLEFTDFILGIQKIVPPTQVREAIEAELASLEALAKEENGAHFVIRAADQQQSVQFNSQAEYIAYRLLPAISQLDPAWAASVKGKYTILRNLESPSQRGPIQLTGAVTPPGQTATSSDVAAAMDDHRLLQVTMTAENEPKRAAEIAATIQDPGQRAVALAIVAPYYSKSEPQEADAWRSQANAELERLPAGNTRLKLIAALAKDSLVNGDENRATSLFDKAFDLGEELFAEDLKANPGKMAYESQGEGELTELSEAFAKYPKISAATLSRVQST
jgi:hypothetical protein